ncbi:MAG: ABC transporter permease subunit [Oscillospiraceae bacterium]|nr:ABC transporter permease subunit [Oscillospiraceae bacterium]
MKKILAIVLALAMILSLAACGSKAEETKPAESVKTTEAAKTETVKEEKEPVTLEFLCWGAAEETTADAFKAMLDGFMEKYPWITVEVTESNYPIISAVIRSFCDYTFLTVNKPLKWNDFANYKTIFKNGFLTQLWTTMKFTVGTVGIELVLGMSIALLLNTKIRGRNALRSVFLMPWCIPSIVTALLWSWLFQAQYGIINYVLYGLGLISNPTAEWVLNPSTSLGVVTIAVVWRQTPYMLVMILAGLQSINHDLVEAASIDGANSFRVFWHITLPGIRVVLGNTIITCIMASFQQFTIIYNMTAGGPLGKTTTLSIAAYKQAFTQLDLGAGSAIGVIWMMLLGAAIAIYNMKTKRFDEL